jgi:hypothetical protein
MPSGQSRTVADSTPGYTGSITASCSNGAVSYSGASCVADDCAGYVGGFGACSFNIASLASGGSSSSANTTAGYTGSISYSCANGNYTFGDWSQSCRANCAATTTSSGSCSYSIPALTSGTNTTVADSTAGYTGSITASCSNGSLAYSGATCVQDLVAPSGAWIALPNTALSNASITISWGATGSVTDYQITTHLLTDYSFGSATSWSGIADSAGGFTGGSYTVSVRACNAAGCSPRASAVMVVSTPPPTPPPATSCTVQMAPVGSYYFGNQSPSALYGICSSASIQPGSTCPLFGGWPCYQAGSGQSGGNPNGAPLLYRDNGTAPAVCGSSRGLCSSGSATGVLDRGDRYTWSCYPSSRFGMPVECEAPK